MTTKLPPVKVLMISPGIIPSSTLLEKTFIDLFELGLVNFRISYYQELDFDYKNKNVEWCDILILLRSFDALGENLLKVAKEKNKIVVYCTDDDLRTLDPQSPLGKHYLTKQNISCFESICKGVDQIWVYTDEMLSRLSEFNPNVKLIKAPSPIDYSVNFQKKCGHDKVVIGYAGSSTHFSDISVSVNPILKILEKYGEKIRFEFVNCIPEQLKEINNVYYIPYFENIDTFYSYLKKSKWDIGLALLEDNLFNRGKTNNKYREFGALGIPGIYSKMPVYSNSIKHLENGYLVDHTEESIFEALEEMILSKELRNKIKANALADVSVKYSYRIVNNEILHLINQLLIGNNINVTPVKILVIGYRNLPSTDLAAFKPFKFLNVSYEFREPGQISINDIKNCNCLFIVRAFIPEMIPILEIAENNNKPIISVWDDDFIALSRIRHSLGKQFASHEGRNAIERILSGSDIVFSSTPPLTKQSRFYNPNVIEAIYGFDNDCLPQFELEDKPDKQIRIGFFGVNDAIKNPFVLNALQNVRANYGNRISIEFIAPNLSKEYTKVADLSWTNQMDMEQSLCLLGSRQWDIGLAPLEDSEFNASKQATKFRDYAWCGASMICSDVPTYRRVMLNEIHGLLVENTVQKWQIALEELINDNLKRRFLCDNAKKLLEAEHYMNKTIAAWEQIIWRIIKYNNREYILSKKQAEVAQDKFTDTKGPMIPIPVGREVRSMIEPMYDNWIGIDIKIETTRDIIHDCLALSIYTKEGANIRQNILCGNNENILGFYSFNFTPIKNSKNIPFVLFLKFTSSNNIYIFDTYYDSRILTRIERKIFKYFKATPKIHDLYCRLRFEN